MEDLDTATSEFDHDCPWCGKHNELASNVTSESPPSPGDVSICIECANWSVFDDDMMSRKVAEDDPMMADPKIKIITLAVQQLREKER